MLTYTERLEKDFLEYSKSKYAIFGSTHVNLLNPLFNKIYFINYIKNRIENRKLFNSIYFDVTFSCLIEGLVLFSQNYLRSCSLVLRSSIENYAKHILFINGESIDKKVYINNKNKIDSVISKSLLPSRIKLSVQKLNDILLSHYKKLSGLSHSLTVESTRLTFSFTTDLDIINSDNIKYVAKYFNSILDSIIYVILIQTRGFLNLHFSEYDLKKILLTFMGDKRSKRFISIIKENQDVQFIN